MLERAPPPRVRAAALDRPSMAFDERVVAGQVVRNRILYDKEAMVTPQFWIAAATYLVLTFIIAAGWHLALFKNVYARLGVFTRARPIISLGILSMVLQAAVVAYLYPFFYRGGDPLTEGAAFGLLLGVFMGSNAVLAEAGKNQVASLRTWIVLEGVYYVLQFTAVGLVIGLVYGLHPQGVPS